MLPILVGTGVYLQVLLTAHSETAFQSAHETGRNGIKGLLTSKRTGTWRVRSSPAARVSKMRLLVFQFDARTSCYICACMGFS